MATDAANSTNSKDTNPSKTPEDSFSPAIKPPSTLAKTDSNNSTTPTASAVSVIEKKIRRAERFGITVQLSEQEKRNSRAERFGTAPMSQGSDASKANEDLKRKARAERFGIPVPPTESDEDAKKKARLERFAAPPKVNSEEEDKKKARAARFSQTPSVAPTLNGKGNIKPQLRAKLEEVPEGEPFSC